MAVAAGGPGAALRLLREPVPAEKKRLMRQRWESLDPRWRFETQGYGRQATGCGATIGAQPRCDFDCTGCYLGSGANRVRPFPLEDLFRQLLALRRHLGPKGNVQITDGEVTLRSPGDLVALLRRARSLGLIPMVMTHGDTFRRRPGLLERLVEEGGLTEVSVHIDTTQRGRLGYRDAAREEELDPLREEFAEMIRAVRRRTGRPLRAATTLTITRENLEGVAPVTAWCLRNRDVFGLVSFQPMARVGRTRETLAGVAVEELWERIAGALAPYGYAPPGDARLHYGHPDCTRIETMGVLEGRDGRPRIFPILRPGQQADREMMCGFLDRGLGGVNYRDDTALERVCRTVGVFLTDPRWFLGPVRRWVAARAAELGESLPSLLAGAVSGRLRVGAFAVVSHHFMDPAAILTPAGRERLAACVFRVPVDGDLVPMCEVNAGGLRERVYERGGAVPAEAVAGAGAPPDGSAAAAGIVGAGAGARA